MGVGKLGRVENHSALRDVCHGGSVLCDIRLGWRSAFWNDKLIITHNEYPAYIIRISDIVRGSLLPPEGWAND